MQDDPSTKHSAAGPRWLALQALAGCLITVGCALAAGLAIAVGRALTSGATAGAGRPSLAMAAALAFTFTGAAAIWWLSRSRRPGAATAATAGAMTAIVAVSIHESAGFFPLSRAVMELTGAALLITTAPWGIAWLMVRIRR